jgi:hypothetical protein
LWKNGAEDAYNKLFKSEGNEENGTSITNNEGGTDIKDITKKFDPNMGLDQGQLSKMNNGLNIGVQALNMVDNMTMGNKNFGA